ncbi:MAG: AAA15 family ATPase/GTPase [Rickettsiales bacterium]|jgi:AAA15 family ATPase/GTPase
MLISFSVTNFRSIKGKQAIDMGVATKYHEEKKTSVLKNNFFKTGDETAPKLLKSSAIYGANASGKTNLIRAVYSFNHVVMCFEEDRGKRTRGSIIEEYHPFKLDETSKNKPTEFEIDFIAEGKRYLYGFSYDQTRIHHEFLKGYFDGKEELIYDLKLNKKNKLEENFTNHFEGKNEGALDIVKNTENNLFLLLNVNEDGNKFLNPVHDWIADKLIIEEDHNNFGQTLRWINKDKKNKEKALEVLKNIDVGIVDFEIETIEREIPKRIVEDKDIPDKVKSMMKKGLNARFKTTNGYYLNSNEISLGIGAAFSLCSVIFPILANGGILFFDDLDQRLHPDVLIHFVKMFHNPKINKGNGQIVFTAHNDILLEKDYEVFRRDQIWFTSKDEKTQSTELYSLVEFTTETKKRDNIAQLYRNHYYGARPFLNEFKF